MDTQKKRKDILYKAVIFVIVLAAFGSMVYFGSKKNGYHVDEIYSYGLANSEYLPFMHFGVHDYMVKDWMKEYGAGESFGELFRNLMKDYKILKEADFDIYSSSIYQDYRVAQANSADTKTTTWMSGKDYLHYIAVSPENTFNYASVYYNQRGDVHPPFFYMLLHTVCSVFQGSFSKWYGLGINIVFMLLTMWILYKLCRELVKSKVLTVAILAMYAFSSGFMTTAMFIRMYAILTFFVLLSCYLHIKAVKKEFRLSKKERFKLALVTLLGFLTHYYFVIYAIGLAMVCCIWMLAKKCFKPMFTYILTMAITGGLGILVWPFAIKHVFFGYRGQGSLQALLQIEVYFIKIKLMLGQVFGPIFGAKWWIWVLVAIVLIIIALFAKSEKVNRCQICLVVIPATLYVLLVSQIVPYYTDRYVMCIYPFVCIAFLSIIYDSFCVFYKRWGFILKEDLRKIGAYTAELATVLAVIIVCATNNYFVKMPGYMFPEGQELVQVPENTDCIFVLPDGDWNESAEESSIMAQCRKVGVVYESNLATLQPEYHCQSGDYLLLYIQKNMDVDNVLRKVHETFGTQGLEEVYRENSSGAVRILLSNR